MWAPLSTWKGLGTTADTAAEIGPDRTRPLVEVRARLHGQPCWRLGWEAGRMVKPGGGALILDGWEAAGGEAIGMVKPGEGSFLAPAPSW